MEKVIKINENMCLSGNHLVKTERGWIEAKDITEKDYIIGPMGELIKIKKIVKCDKSQGAPIIGKTSEKK